MINIIYGTTFMAQTHQNHMHIQQYENLGSAPLTWMPLHRKNADFLESLLDR